MVLARSYYGIPVPLSTAARLLNGGASGDAFVYCEKAINEMVRPLRRLVSHKFYQGLRRKKKDEKTVKRRAGKPVVDKGRN